MLGQKVYYIIIFITLLDVRIKDDRLASFSFSSLILVFLIFTPTSLSLYFYFLNFELSKEGTK